MTAPSKAEAPDAVQRPAISVCVIAYNHGPYIIECLEGIRQQTDCAPYEVIIRDDASTDDTGQLVSAYIERHRLAHFHYHRAAKNGGMMPNLTQALALCRGDFIAICEGDDYWIDPAKLQRQHALMAATPGCAISTHSCYVRTADGRMTTAFQRGTAVRTFDLREILQNSSTQFAPTASYMIRRDVIVNLPDWFEGAPIGDVFLEVLSLKRGHGLYMPQPMSTYRLMSSGSWSSGMRDDRRRSIEYGHKMLKLLSALEADAQLRDNGLEVWQAHLHALLASDFLLCGDYPKFRHHIEASFHLNRPWQSKTARALYRMRRFPALAARVYRAKRRYFE